MIRPMRIYLFGTAVLTWMAVNPNPHIPELLDRFLTVGLFVAAMLMAARALIEGDRARETPPPNQRESRRDE